ncbi:MAG: hypothetical protein WCG83_01845 [Candidatus Peregrinibacteria bacterium]
MLLILGGTLWGMRGGRLLISGQVVSSLCGDTIAEADEQCDEPGLVCASGQTCRNCLCETTFGCPSQAPTPIPSDILVLQAAGIGNISGNRSELTVYYRNGGAHSTYLQKEGISEMFATTMGNNTGWSVAQVVTLDPAAGDPSIVPGDRIRLCFTGGLCSVFVTVSAKLPQLFAPPPGQCPVDLLISDSSSSTAATGNCPSCVTSVTFSGVCNQFANTYLSVNIQCSCDAQAHLYNYGSCKTTSEWQAHAADICSQKCIDCGNSCPTASSAASRDEIPVCHNDIPEPGEQCGEPGLSCPFGQFCHGCQCSLCGNYRLDSSEQCEFGVACSEGLICNIKTCQCESTVPTVDVPSTETELSTDTTTTPPSSSIDTTTLPSAIPCPVDAPSVIPSDLLVLRGAYADSNVSIFGAHSLTIEYRVGSGIGTVTLMVEGSTDDTKKIYGGNSDGWERIAGFNTSGMFAVVPGQRVQLCPDSGAACTPYVTVRGQSQKNEIPAGECPADILVLTASSAPCSPSWQCNTWGACVGGVRGRTCTNTAQCGTSDGKPPESEVCTGSTSGTCTPFWVCSSWNGCPPGYSFDPNQMKSRTCYDNNHCGDTTNKPVESQSCAANCTPYWQCYAWGICTAGLQTRLCGDLNNCGVANGQPPWSQSCITEPPTL